MVGRLENLEDAARDFQLALSWLIGIGVGRARKTIDAAVLAAAIGVDRAVETNIGRGIARDDRARAVDDERGGKGRRRLVSAAPTVVEGNTLLRLEPADRIAESAAALAQQCRIEGHHVGDDSSSMRTFQERSSAFDIGTV